MHPVVRVRVEVVVVQRQVVINHSIRVILTRIPTVGILILRRQTVGAFAHYSGGPARSNLVSVD